ncbi:hypothetical protein CHH69_13630, partial [Terribacillus saccharophilus]|uniref:hypothetical protein n=1 Tax=Terribacillus saccharophilus TaxID=361277 RepID=UPI000BC885DF
DRMKNVFLLFLIIALIFSVSGCAEKYDDKTIRKAEEATITFINNNFEGVHSIELEEPYQSPMGSLTVPGTVNGAGFTASLNKDFTIAGIGSEEGFPELREDCVEKTCE